MSAAYSKNECRELREFYLDHLFHDTLPFWFPRCLDVEHGGYFTCLNRDGSLMQRDKSIWFQGRTAWMLSTLYADHHPTAEWLDWARSGIDFLLRHGFDDDGRMFFSVTDDGRPLRKRRYVFSELFACMALAAFGRATGDTGYFQKAEALFSQVGDWLARPGFLPPKTDPATRPMKGLALPMILICVAQELRKAAPDRAPYDRAIQDWIEEMESDFFKPQFGALLEVVGPNGEFYDTLDGRQVNPGHSLEAAWFILREAADRGHDPGLLELGLRILDVSWVQGWDPEHGGILYYTDCKGLPPTEYWHDMKFWWPQNEAIIATLMAWRLTGEERYAAWHRRIHEWAHRHFPDPEHGEWFGYLHRDGTLSTPVKGTLFKGPFHLPRMQWVCAELLQ